MCIKGLSGDLELVFLLHMKGKKRLSKLGQPNRENMYLKTLSSAASKIFSEYFVKYFNCNNKEFLLLFTKIITLQKNISPEMKKKCNPISCYFCMHLVFLTT